MGVNLLQDPFEKYGWDNHIGAINYQLSLHSIIFNCISMIPGSGKIYMYGCFFFQVELQFHFFLDKKIKQLLITIQIQLYHLSVSKRAWWRELGKV